MSLCRCGGGGAGGGVGIGGPFYDMRDFGGVADGCRVTDGAITAGSITLVTATSTPFLTTAPLGKFIQVTGAGVSGGALQTTVVGINAANTVTLAAPASTTVAGAAVLFGTIDTGALVNIGAAGFILGGGTVVFDMGITILDGGADDIFDFADATTCGLGWSFVGYGYGATIIAQAGSWNHALISTGGRHSVANTDRFGPGHICAIRIIGDPDFGGVIFDGFQAKEWTGDWRTELFAGTIVQLTGSDDCAFTLRGTGNGKLANGSPSVKVQQHDEGGLTVGVTNRTHLHLDLLDNRDHGVYLSQDVETIVTGRVKGSGTARSAIWSTDSISPTLDGDFTDGGDDDVHVQSEGNASYLRARGRYSRAGGATPGTGHGVNIAKVTTGQVQLGHDPNSLTEGDVAGWPQDATADVATAENTGSTVYGDLATVGPAVTVNLTPARPFLRITVSARCSNNTGADGALMSFAGPVPGAVDGNACGLNVEDAGGQTQGVFERSTLITNLPAGAYTATAKYRAVTGGTATFANRRITARAEAA